MLRAQIAVLFESQKRQDKNELIEAYNPTVPVFPRSSFVFFGAFLFCFRLKYCRGGGVLESFLWRGGGMRYFAVVYLSETTQTGDNLVMS